LKLKLDENWIKFVLALAVLMAVAMGDMPTIQNIPF
tara:strand:+ start:590 stop:697 length:108 start_codon:yes stop_codon:yes gene_type:complete